MSRSYQVSVQLDRYPQEFAATIGAKQGLPLTRCLLAVGDTVYAGTDEGLFTLTPQGAQPASPALAGPVTALCLAKGRLTAATPQGVVALADDGWQAVDQPADVLAMAGSDRLLAIAGNDGLRLVRDSVEHVPYPAAAEVQGIAVGPKEEVYLATSAGLWRCDGGWQTFGAGEENKGMASTDARAVWVDRFGHALVGTAAGLELFDGQGWWERLQGKPAGLPYEDVTCLTTLGAVTWLGTRRGLIRLEGAEWDYYANRRWLPDDEVLAVAATGDAVYALTPAGVGCIYTQMMTLEEKAAYFEDRIQKRHYRLAYVADCHLPDPDDFDNFIYEASDNDGLWTSIYVAAEIYRYVATGSPEARARATKSLNAMLDLERKCSLRGYIARALVRKDEPNTHKSGGEWHDTADGLYEWKGDVSSDEYVGHFWVYPLFYDLVANEEEKAQIRAVAKEATDYVIDNGLVVLDVDGKPTTWGVWAPQYINDDPKCRSERGLNSLIFLAQLRAVHHMTGEQRYLDLYRQLIEQHHYALNTIYQKVLPPIDMNHSDDEMAWCGYWPLLAYEDDPDLRRIFTLSFEHSFKIERPEHNPWFNFAYGDLTGKMVDLEECVKVLRDFPMDLRTWRIENSQRADLTRNPYEEMFERGRPCSTTAIPADERRTMRWNGAPYRMDDGGNGTSEDDGATFLLCYWYGRACGYLVEAR